MQQEKYCDECKGNHYINKQGALVNCPNCTTITTTNELYTSTDIYDKNTNKEANMCEVLILGKYTNNFINYLSHKKQTDQIVEFKKMVKSFNGTYIIRRGIQFSEYHGIVIISFTNEVEANSFIDACKISDYLAKSEIFKLCSVEQLEKRFLNVSATIKMTEEQHSTT